MPEMAAPCDVKAVALIDRLIYDPSRFEED